MFLTIVGIFLVIVKFIFSIMILLLTFIAHSIYQYLNKRLKHQQKVASNQTVQQTTVVEAPNTSFTEPEIFLFNESFDLNLLNLKKRKSINSIGRDAEEESLELINNLNKLYKNENIETQNDLSMGYLLNEEKSFVLSQIDSFDMDTMSMEMSQELDVENESVDLDNDSLFNTILFDTDNQTIVSTPLDKKPDPRHLINLENLCMSLGFLSPDETSNQSTSSLNSTLSSSTKESTKIKIKKAYSSLKRSMTIKNKIDKGHIRLNKSLNTCDSSLIKTKKFRTRFERIKQTKKFYQRRQRTCSLSSQCNQADSTQILLNLIQYQSRTNKLSSSSYKPSFKVEKLLNDSRGMKKYLIDYDCLMSHQKKTISLSNLNSFKLSYDNVNQESMASSLETNSVLFDKFRSSFMLFNNNSNAEIISDNNQHCVDKKSNRCSSGYLSDC